MYWLHKLKVDLGMFLEKYFKSNIWHELAIVINIFSLNVLLVIEKL